MLYEIPCIQMRGGTSKGLYLKRSDLPLDEALWPAIFMSLMGTPDRIQVDGLGGTLSTSSKIAVVWPSDREDADVEYLFAQVGVEEAIVSYQGNCGNICTGVGPYAIEAGLVSPKEPVTVVRIHNVNTDKLIHAHIEVTNGRVNYDGTQAIAGVPGTSAPIRMSFRHPAGSVTGKLQPTGEAVTALEVPGEGTLKVSFVDATNPAVFVKAGDLGLTGKELPKEVNADAALLHRLEVIRGAAAVRLGLLEDYRQSAQKTAPVPKLILVSAPVDYISADNVDISAESYDILCRQMSMQKMHQTYALTGAMVTAAAAVLPGTVVQQLIAKPFAPGRVRVGHPGGVMEAGVDYSTLPDGSITVEGADSFRTARILMRGSAYYRLP